MVLLALVLLGGKKALHHHSMLLCAPRFFSAELLCLHFSVPLPGWPLPDDHMCCRCLFWGLKTNVVVFSEDSSVVPFIDRLFAIVVLEHPGLVLAIQTAGGATSFQILSVG